MTQQWYLRTSEGDLGPLNPSLLDKLSQSGKITPDTLLSLDRKSWTPASQLSLLSSTERTRTDLASPASSPVKNEEATPSSQRPRGSHQGQGLYEGLGAEQLGRLYPTSAADELEVDNIKPDNIAARFGQSFVAAAGAASAIALIVQLLVALGAFDLPTIATSLAVRVGLPGLVFVFGFVVVYWYLGIEVRQVQITSKMNDDEIASLIKNS